MAARVLQKAKGSRLFRIGCIVAIIVSVAWLIGVGVLNSSLASQVRSLGLSVSSILVATAAPWVTLIASIGGIVLMRLDGSSQSARFSAR